MSTYDLNRNILTSHLDGKPLPINPTSRAIHIRHMYQCWNWGLNNNLIQKSYPILGDTKGESTLRVYTDGKLNLMITGIVID